MFTVEERERVRQRLIDLARADPGVVGAAVIGSSAVDGADRWSDIDLAFAIDGPLDAALDRWTGRLNDEFGARHHWDLPAGSTIYRVFLLPGWLEVDLAFARPAEFGPRGPAWRTVFGEPAALPQGAPPVRDSLVGRAWHHALHARICIERGRPWQAEYWISAMRDQVLALACLRLGLPTEYAKGAHLLPAALAESLTTAFEAALVRSLHEAELRRALAAAVAVLAAELARTDPALAARLAPALTDLTNCQA